MNYEIFREYDIRGIVGKEFTGDDALLIGKGIVTYLKSCKPDLKTMMIGRDGRNSSPAIFENIAKSALQAGIDVVDIGIVASPVFYFALHTTDVVDGVMITASHNPKDYNGFKICINQKNIHGPEIQKIKTIIVHNQFAPDAPKLGKVSNFDAITPYLNWTCEQFKHLKNSDLAIAFDCANAASAVVMPRLVKMMGWKNCITLYDDLDGNFPNHEADPTVAANMVLFANYLKNNPQFELGIGFDGDADRMAPIMNDGKPLAGDLLLTLFSKQVLATHPGATVVFDIKSSDILVSAIKKHGGKPVMAATGHSNIKKAIEKHHAVVAGELSCHFFFSDRAFGYDDGIYAAMRLIEIIIQEGRSLEKLIEQFPSKSSSPEYRIPCKEEEKGLIIEAARREFAQHKNFDINTIDGIRVQTSYGWGLLRQSNTQPMVSLRFEADNNEDLEHLKKDFHSVLTPFIDETLLDEHFAA